MRALILVVALIWIAPALAPSTADAAGKNAILGPVEANASAATGKVVLIDIRHPSEWRETGVASPAKTITMHDPKGPNAFLDAVVTVVGGDMSRPVALICASGVRSTWAQRFLAARGFRHVYNVKEGMLGPVPGPDGFAAASRSSPTSLRRALDPPPQRPPVRPLSTYSPYRVDRTVSTSDPDRE